MSSPFNLDPVVIADLAAASAADERPLAPLPIPVVLDRDGCITVPPPGSDPDALALYVHPGVRASWVPVPELDGLILVLFGGPDRQDDFEEEGVAAFFTRRGFHRFVTELRSIADQVTDAAAKTHSAEAEVRHGE